MRKSLNLLVVLLVLCFAVSGAFGQTSIEKGAIAMLNFAKLHGNDVTGVDTRTTIGGGIFLGIAASPLITIQPEVLYMMKGAKEKAQEQGMTITATYKLDYIEIPLLVKLNIPVQNSDIKPNIFVGPELGIKVKSKVKGEGGGASVEIEIPDVKSTDFGLIFGASVGIPLNNSTLYIGGDYDLGLTSIDNSADNASIKNGVISIFAAIGFH